MDLNLNNFNNANILLVFAILMCIFNFRHVGEFLLQTCISCEDFVSKNILQALCGCNEIGFLYVFRGCLILYNFSLPFLFSLVHLYRQSTGMHNLSILMMPSLRRQAVACTQHDLLDLFNETNASNPWNFEVATAKNVRAALQGCLHESNNDEVDALVFIDAIYVVFPFAFATSINCLVWVNLAKSNHLTENTVWDENMDEEVVTYEISYLMETLGCNFALIALMSVGQPIMYILMFAVLFTIVEAFFIINSKYSQTTQSCGNAFVLMVIVFAFGILIPMLSSIAVAFHVTGALLAGIFVFKFCLNILQHYIAQGQMRAGYIILLRLGCACFASLGILCFFILQK